MIHPLFQTLAMRPELLVEHLGAYAQLATVEVSETTERLRQRALLIAMLTVSAALGLGLGGIALLLLGVVPLAQMPAAWLLAVVPVVPLVLALICWLRLRQSQLNCSFDLLREHLALDTALLRESSDH